MKLTTKATKADLLTAVKTMEKETRGLKEERKVLAILLAVLSLSSLMMGCGSYSNYSRYDEGSRPTSYVIDRMGLDYY